MIVANFMLTSPVLLGDALRLVGENGTITRLAATKEGWTFHVSFPDFGATSDVFARLLDRNVDFDVRRLTMYLDGSEIR